MSQFSSNPFLQLSTPSTSSAPSTFLPAPDHLVLPDEPVLSFTSQTGQEDNRPSARFAGPSLGAVGKVQKIRKGQHKQTVVRQAAGAAWEDPTLLEWDEAWFCLFIGNISNDVNEKMLQEAFEKYPSFKKCRVVKDRLTNKARYGFVGFEDPQQGLKAWREMTGQFVGNRPITIKKAEGNLQTTSISASKQRRIVEGLNGGANGGHRAKSGGKNGHGRISGVARPTPY